MDEKTLLNLAALEKAMGKVKGSTRKRRIVGMCRRCGTEFFSAKARREHKTGIGCGVR